MKLLAKYNRVNIPITIAVLILSSTAYYFILHYFLLRQVDKDLRIEQQEIIHHVAETGTLPEASYYKDQQISFQPVAVDQFKNRIKTVRVYNKNEDEQEPFRKIDFLVMQNGKNYIATVKKSLQETEDIVRLILVITFLVIAFLLVILFISNRFLLAKLWRPFNNTLEQLKNFSLSSRTEITPQSTNIEEFNELNRTAIFLTQKVKSDYDSLKSFTGNASHEIQTPLAIIKNKIELLSQSEHLEEQQIEIIKSLNAAASRLSRLNHSLLLLTRIENHLFESSEKINLSLVLERCLENFSEPALLKGIRLQYDVQPLVELEINESLADILVSNLVLNALKHNIPGGYIDLVLQKNFLQISNTGATPKIRTSELFERFKKDSSHPESLGLGLSIVKTICDIYSFHARYDFVEGQHCVRVDFI